MMRTDKMSLAVLLVVLLTVPAWAANRPAEPPVGPYLQSISVNIKASASYSGGVQGSGTLILVPRTGTNRSAWVLTAAHVVDGLREVKSVIGGGGSDKKMVRYRDAQIVQEVQDQSGGRFVGDTRLDAKVISVDESRDLALLRVRAVGKFDASAKFYLEDDIPPAGTEVYHCGAPGGQELGGSCSLTDGIISRTGVRIPDFGGAEEGVYDQSSVDGLPGSSGGLIALKADGRIIGVLTLGTRSTDSFHWFVPVRSIREWAKEIKIEWLLDEGGKLPSEEEIDKIPLEFTPGMPNSDEKDDEKDEKATPQLLPAIHEGLERAVDMPLLERPDERDRQIGQLVRQIER